MYLFQLINEVSSFSIIIDSKVMNFRTADCASLGTGYRLLSPALGIPSFNRNLVCVGMLLLLKFVYVSVIKTVFVAFYNQLWGLQSGWNRKVLRSLDVVRVVRKLVFFKRWIKVGTVVGVVNWVVSVIIFVAWVAWTSAWNWGNRVSISLFFFWFLSFFILLPSSKD